MRRCQTSAFDSARDVAVPYSKLSGHYELSIELITSRSSRYSTITQAERRLLTSTNNGNRLYLFLTKTMLHVRADHVCVKVPT